MYDEQSDIFAATAVFFAMLTGHAPWETTFSPGVPRNSKISLMKEKRKTPINVDDLPVDEGIKNLIQKGLAVPYSQRYNKVAEVLERLANRDEQSQAVKSTPGAKPEQTSSIPHPKQAKEERIEVQKATGKGFADIAGMQALKDMLQLHLGEGFRPGQHLHPRLAREDCRTVSQG